MSIRRNYLKQISRLLIILILITGFHFQNMEVESSYAVKNATKTKVQFINTERLAETKIACEEQTTFVKGASGIFAKSSNPIEEFNDFYSRGEEIYMLFVHLINMPYRSQWLHLISDYKQTSGGIISRYLHKKDGLKLI